MRMHRSWISACIFFTTSLLAGTGCELIAAVDREQIDTGATGTGTGGQGGTGGTGGMAGGGMAGAGGTGGMGGDAGGPMGQGGGGGSPLQCQTPSDCGTDTECDTWTCNQNVCGHNYAPQGTLTSKQIVGDCSRNACDGNGGEGTIPDDGDLPNDSKECTLDACSNGVPEYNDVMIGTSCTENGGKVCNGMGECVACVVDAHCPVGQTCSMMGTCVP